MRTAFLSAELSCHTLEPMELTGRVHDICMVPYLVSVWLTGRIWSVDCLSDLTDWFWQVGCVVHRLIDWAEEWLTSYESWFMRWCSVSGWLRGWLEIGRWSWKTGHETVKGKKQEWLSMVDKPLWIWEENEVSGNEDDSNDDDNNDDGDRRRWYNANILGAVILMMVN